MKKLFFRVSTISFFALIMLLVTTFALPCVKAQADSTTPQCWGVFVGISTYQNYLGSAYGDNDARELSEKLSPTWGSSHVRLLTNSQATKSAILSAIDWLATNADINDTVILFYSSYVWGFDSSHDYLSTYDCTSSLSTGISSSELANSFRSIKAGKITIIFNYFYTRDLLNALTDSGRVILMCSPSDGSWWWNNSFQHSVFTYYILQALDKFDTTDTNNDYELSAEEIYEYASPLTTDEHSDQHPVLDDRYSGELPLIAKFSFTTNLPNTGQTILTLDDDNYTLVPPPIFWVPGGSHTMTVPQTVNIDSGTRYAFTGWSDGGTSTTRTVTKGSFTANYQKEYLLTVNSTFGSPAGGTWYKEDTAATFSVTDYVETSNTKHYFTGWSGDFTGASSSGSLVMSRPRTVTASWRNEYLLTINSAFGNPVGAGWYQQGSSATFSITATVETSDTKHYFTGWSGDLTETTASGTLVMSSPKTVTANWRHEYLLTINSDYGTPTGAGWYDEGEKASINVAPEQGFIIRHIFTGWSGALTTSQPSSEIRMNSPATITANWQTDYIQLYIVIGIVVVLGAVITVVLVVVRRKKV